MGINQRTNPQPYEYLVTSQPAHVLAATPAGRVRAPGQFSSTVKKEARKRSCLAPSKLTQCCDWEGRREGIPPQRERLVALEGKRKQGPSLLLLVFQDGSAAQEWEGEQLSQTLAEAGVRRHYLVAGPPRVGSLFFSPNAPPACSARVSWSRPNGTAHLFHGCSKQEEALCVTHAD